MRRNLFSRTAAFAMLLLGACSPAAAYSVLSHEAIIDAAWETSLKPVLLDRYPTASADDLIKAHAYAYGGAIIQDMGYYPFGSHFFSDLTHYVRGGDFVQNMLQDAQNVNEYAFALGALAHYAADNVGHLSVNLSVPMLYPKMRAKFGPLATYEDNPADHLKAEFSFDVAEVAENHYAPQAYHDFIGFEVSKPLLERAFEQTYGVPLTDVSKLVDLALGTYRFTVANVIPEMTKVAWNARKKDLQKATPGLTERRFVYSLSRSSFEKEWGRQYQRPGVWSRFLAWLFKLIPKVGPLRALSFHAPTPQTQKLFMEGFVKALSLYKEKLNELHSSGKPNLPNDNFDTGQLAAYGTYRMADQACDKLIVKLQEKKFATVDKSLKQGLLDFYGSATPKDPKAAAALLELKALQV